MLLEFKTANYKSFAEEMVFSMIPAPKQTGLDYSILKEKIGQKNYLGLSSAVIYGPNASGKTNIIGAMDTMKAIVLRGNIKNADALYSPNEASSALELIPNCNMPQTPTSFCIRFVEKGLVIAYAFTALLGSFLEKGFSRKILSETLTVNEKPVFTRTENLTVELPNCIKPYLHAQTKGLQNLQKIAQSGLDETELFLCNGFKTIFAKDLVSLILNWFENKLLVIVRSDLVKAQRMFSDAEAGKIYVEKTLTDASRIFGISSNALGYRASSDGAAPILCSIFEDKKMAMPAESFESFGTIRFVNEFPLVIDAMMNGGTLVMDEFDASIHPMALMNIINIFHNDDINKNHAQLIFNTHNPIFLNAGLFRRDEIKFVERDVQTGYSTHYALSDFRTADGVRKGEDYMKNYFVSRYGAIKDIDFSPIFETLINREGGDDDAQQKG